MTSIERLILPELWEPVSHYCHVVRTGDRIWVSGSVGANPDGSIPEDIVEQFEVAMRNFDASLRAVGGRPEHVGKVTVFLTDITERPRINPIRERYFGEHRPASTLVEVSALVSPEMKVEIEGEAVVTE